MMCRLWWVDDSLGLNSVSSVRIIFILSFYCLGRGTAGVMESIIIDLHIAAEEYQRLYRGTAQDVIARARDGRRVRFPARILMPFVEHRGVVGSFEILVDGERRFKTIKRIS